MSIAERPAGTRARVGGFTMLEVMVTLIMIGVMASIVDQTIGSAHRAEQQLQAVRRATERSERLAYEILDEVNRSRKLFQGDVRGQGYLDALELIGSPLLPAARLPVFDELNPLGADDAGDPRTGNVLLFAVEAEAAETIADAATAKARSIDLYRFVCIYPSETQRILLPAAPRLPARDLVLWRSQRFPSHAQIMAVADLAERASVVSDLVNRYGCDFAWDANADADAAFYPIGVLGAVASSPAGSMRIEEDVDESEGGRTVYADVQLSRTVLGDYYRRSLFTSDDPMNWTPDGFEIKIVGVSGARKVWYRLSMESPGGKDIVGVQSCTMIAGPRDM